MKLVFRGIENKKNIVNDIAEKDYSFLDSLNLGFSVMYTSKNLEFYAVDLFASLPIYYVYSESKGYIFSSTVETLLNEVDCKVNFDPIGYTNCNFYTTAERTKHTVFKEIKKLLPGTYIEIDKGKFNEVKYWSFRSLKAKHSVDYTDFQSIAENLGKLVVKSVKECINQSSETAIHLTGGMDSGSIAYLYSQRIKGRGEAYYLNSQDIVFDNEKTEKHYLELYKNHCKNLDFNQFDWDIGPDVETSSFNKQSKLSDHWFATSHEFKQSLITEDAQKKGIKYILTGLGGDELASYGSSLQKGRISIHNDWMSTFYWEFYLNTYSDFRVNISNWIRGSNRNKLAIKSRKWESSLSNFARKNYAEWFTDDFLDKSKRLFVYSNSYFLPCSQKYRLECLDRQYFTQRSDAWNTVGLSNDVIFIHPLLHRDIVEFCALIPRKIYANSEPRELFKEALKEFIPEELLRGDKRQTFYLNKYEAHTTIEILEETINELALLENTFAASVYNYKKMKLRLIEIVPTLSSRNKIPKDYLLMINDFILYYTNEFILNGNYLNRFF